MNEVQRGNVESVDENSTNFNSLTSINVNDFLSTDAGSPNNNASPLTESIGNQIQVEYTFLSNAEISEQILLNQPITKTPNRKRPFQPAPAVIHKIAHSKPTIRRLFMLSSSDDSDDDNQKVVKVSAAKNETSASDELASIVHSLNMTSASSSRRFGNKVQDNDLAVQGGRLVTNEITATL